MRNQITGLSDAYKQLPVIDNPNSFTKMITSPPSSTSTSTSSSTITILLAIFVLIASIHDANSLPLYASGSASSSSLSNSKKLAPIVWSTTNKLFSDLTNSGLNYYLKLSAQIGDNIDLICPKSPQHQSGSQLDESNRAEYSIIYKVGTKYEFDNCLVNPNEPETVQILKCDKPNALNPTKYTMNFVKFSPVPNAPEFEEEKEYYFLSTSSGSRDGLTHMAGGLCSKFNMRFSIRISSSSASSASNGINFYNLKNNELEQQQQYNNNNKNNVSLLSHIFTYTQRDRDHMNNINNNKDSPQHVTQHSITYDENSIGASSILDQQFLDKQTTLTTGDESTETPQLSKLNLMVSSYIYYYLFYYN